ncbi:MAG: hypothetical protein IJ172_11410 [Ruminococcus sp.]|nr:hypothetical protein [Ruminococcus sp.]
MKQTYKAKIISINGNNVTYEYNDAGGFVQISSLKPSGINVKKGDTVWITVENGAVISVGKRRKLLSTPFGIKFLGILVLMIFLLVLWLVWFILKKVLIAVAWVVIILAFVVFIFTKLRR